MNITALPSVLAKSQVFQLDFHMATLLPVKIFRCLDNLSCDMGVVKFRACCVGIQGKEQCNTTHS